MSNDESLILY